MKLEVGGRHRQVVSLLTADNSAGSKTRYNAPISAYCGGYCHDSASLLLPARGLGTPVAVCPAAPRRVPLRRDAPDEASHAHHAASHAFRRAYAVCGPDAQAALCPVCARSCASPSAPSRATRAAAPDPPPPPHGGHLEALLSAYGLCLPRLAGAGQPARQRPSQRWPGATMPLYGL